MSEQSISAGPTTMAAAAPAEAYRYPEGCVAGVIDTPEQLARAVQALTDDGFREADILVASGPDAADAMHASTGRGGLMNIVLRLAERLGVADEEMELKARYEQALKDGHFVVSVPTPNDERERRAAHLLRAEGGRSVRFMGRFSIHGIVVPAPAP